MSPIEPTMRPKRGFLMRYLARFDDGDIARSVFYGLLAGAVAVIGLDLKTLYDDRQLGRGNGSGAVYVEPALPAALRTAAPEQPYRPDPRQHITLDGEALRQPMQFELLADGVMRAQGAIDVGAARRFAAELEQRGEYVRTLTLNSNGGSLEDALSMARLVRQHGLAVTIEAGALCASSCPLVLAAGTTRNVSANAAVGLHQFYAASDIRDLDPAQAMSAAQATTARVSRHLSEMGVDPALWLHALDTPPQNLYYLSREEMETYRLIQSEQKLARR